MDVVHPEVATDASRSGAEMERLAWPAAALAIIALSAASWGIFALLGHLILG